MSKEIKNTETIEQLFENYKATYNEETPQIGEQITALEQLEQITLNPFGQSTTQEIWHKAIELSRASEKTGFVIGFRMAMNLMSECLG